MTDQSRARLRQQLIRHEGLRLKPYRCTSGKLTIGAGRNLEDTGISEDEAFFLLDNDIDRVIHGLLARFPWFASLDEARQRVLCDMAFQMGVPGLAKFQRTLAAVERGDYQAAAVYMLASKWAQQTPNRATALADLMRAGEGGAA